MTPDLVARMGALREWHEAEVRFYRERNKSLMQMHIQFNATLTEAIAELRSKEATVRGCAEIVRSQSEQFAGIDGMPADFARGWINQCADAILARFGLKGEKR